MSDPSAASDDTSSSLLSRARNHDAAAWLRLVEWIGVFILRWCRRAGLQAADRDEVAQQVLINVWRGLATFRRDRPGDSFRGWVYTITRNCIHDLRARRQRDPAPLPMDLPAEVDPSEADDLKRRALRLLIQDVVARNANEAGFRAFYRTAVDGLPAAEVARELGVSAELVRQHKSRWTKRLRDQLREQFGELLG
jgi:RNA polymerase sigma-70 factor (ECF subfamily)